MTVAARLTGPLLLLLAAALLLSMVLAVGLGAVTIAPGTMLAIVREAIAPSGGVPGWSVGQAHIVVDLRIPRVILAAACGGGLAIAGCVLQSVTRNPLADPYLFGVSAGASVGAVAVILYTGAFLGVATLPLAAFSGAMAAMLLVLSLARGDGGFATERLVLTGVAVHFILTAATNIMVVNAAERGAESALFWMLGSFGAARWPLLPAPVAAFFATFAWALYRARSLDALSLGDEGAHTLGVPVAGLRREVLVATSLITGVLVASAGAVGFVGLVVPHVSRRIVGAEMRRVLPVAALVGALFAVWADVAARLLLAPKELPLGAVTSAIGGLFFIAILRRWRRV